MKLILPFLLCLGCAPSGPRDVTEHKHDVVTNQGQGGYEYIVKKPHGVVAIAESRGIGKDDAKRAVERLADAFERCLTNLEQQAPLKPGAARVIVPVDEGGVVSDPQVTTMSDTSPETRVTVLVCLVGPARMSVFPAPSGPLEGGTRGMAIEATWP